MIQKEILAALNDQMNKELFSAYLYAAISADFAAEDWNGFAHWMTAQAKEEMEHAQKIYEFTLDRGGRPVFAALDKPQETWDSPKAAFEASLKHEQFITASIDELVNVARKLDDKAAEIFLQWFVTEQVEEEASVEAVLAKLERIGDHGQGMFMLDRELGAR
jgi:ferritin